MPSTPMDMCYAAPKNKAGTNSKTKPAYSSSPDITTTASTSNSTYKDNHEMIVFTAIRQREGASDTVELQQYYDTQQAMIKLKQYLFGEDNGPNNFCRKFPHIDVSSVM